MAKAKKKTPAKKATPVKAAKKKAAPAKAAKKKAAPAKKASKPARAAVKASKKAPAKKPVKAKPAAPKAVKAIVVSNVKWDEFLTPLDDRLIVEIAAAERMTPGGLYIPDSVADTSGNFQGLVLVAGRGHRDAKGRVRPMDVKAGNKVLFSEYSGTKINLLGKDVLILRESEILGIVD